MKHVVFLHGLGSHGMTMAFLKKYFDLYYDCKTYSFSYVSITSSLDKITDTLVCEFNNHFSCMDDVYIIGHSLGGVIARKISLSSQIKCRIKKIVTLGTPHNGAILADKILKQFRVLRNLLPIVNELSYNANIIRNIPSITCDIGIISGNKNRSFWNPLIILGRFFLKDEMVHDGVVGLKENYLTGATDFICLHVDHVNLLWSTAVAKQCISFIETSSFK